MTTQDIKEVRLIAKFMGWIPIVTDYHGINLFEYRLNLFFLFY